MPASSQDSCLKNLLCFNTHVRILTAGTEARICTKAISQKLRELEEKWSPYRGNSEISRINQMAGKNEIFCSNETLRLLSSALDYQQKSRGAFNILGGKNIQSWERSLKSPLELIKSYFWSQSFADPGLLHINLKKNTVYLDNEEAAIHPGAIGKGLAADMALELAFNFKIEDLLLDLGGNILCWSRENQKNWRLAIQGPAPFSQEDPCLLWPIKFGALVTSGNYEKFHPLLGRRHHHILDPRRGKPARNSLESVSLLSKSAAKSDALATALMVLGLEQGIDLLKENPHLKAVFILRGKKIMAPLSIQKDIQLLNKNYNLEFY